MDNYIKSSIEDIVESQFNMSISFDLDKYFKILIDKGKGNIIQEIEEYKKYNLISPQIYNLCYLYLCDKSNIESNEIKRILEESVNISKNKMQKIHKFNHYFKDYLDIKKEYENFKKEYYDCRKVKRNPSKVSPQILKVLNRFNEPMSIEAASSEILNIDYDMNRYLELNKSGGLVYEEILLMLIYRALGINKQKHPDRFKSCLVEMLNYAKTGKMHLDSELIDDKLMEYSELMKNKLVECEKTNVEICNKCDGIGWISEFEHIEHGICFSCQGTGIIV